MGPRALLSSGAPWEEQAETGEIPGSCLFCLGFLPLLCSSVVLLLGEPPCFWTEWE